MRTKHLLTMAAMTLGFAACTQEELIENVASNPMDRPALDMTIEFPGTTVDSRLVYDDASFGWKWEAGDKFSAFMTDGVTQWTVGDKLYTNYIYSQGEDGSYSTTSQMVEGMYWFFAPAKESKIDRSLIPFELSTNQPANYYKSEASQVYFSPSYRLDAANNAANVVLKPTVYNLYSQAIFHFKNVSTSTTPNLNVLQILLKRSSGFETKGNIDVATIDAISRYEYKDGAFTQVRNDGARYYTENDLLNTDITDETVTSSSIALNVNKVLKPGETLTATMLVPQVSAEDLEVVIITDEGEIEIKNVVPGEGDKFIYAPELNSVSFKHHGAKYMFGKLSNNAMKPLEIKDTNIKSVSGSKYVASAEDMVALINKSQGNLQITKVGEWSIDENVINAANNNANVLVKFMDNMVVENNSAIEVEMDKFEFAIGKGWTLAKGSVKSDLAPLNVTGGKLNYDGAGTTLVNNGGEIVINSTAVTSLTNNKGKVTVNADITLTTPLVNGVEDTSIGELIINANKTVTLQYSNDGYNVGYTKNNTWYESTIENNGTIVMKNGVFTSEGTINNNGTIKIEPIGTHARIFNEGTVNNYGTINGVNNTAVTPYTGFINNSYLEMTRFAATLTDVLGDGYVNNNANGFVTAATNNENIIYFEASGDVNEVNSGCNLMVVKDNVIGTANVKANVLFLGTTAIRTAMNVEGNVYVFTQTQDDKYDTLAQMLVGTWTSTNKRSTYKANTSLTVQGALAVEGTIDNNATIYNRKTVTSTVAVDNTDGVWQGTAENVEISLDVVIPAP